MLFRSRKMPLPVWLFVFSMMGLQDLCHKISHGLRCLILHLPGGMSIGSERESGIIVTQHPLGFLMELHHGVWVYISPVTGEGNIYWVSVCLPCSWISRSAASCGMETCRTEVSVFDLESITSPLGLRTYCLRTE